MGKIVIEPEEQIILWVALNNAQNQGLMSLSKMIESVGRYDPNNKMVVDWFNQTQKEYEVINTLKAKLCGNIVGE